MSRVNDNLQHETQLIMHRVMLVIGNKDILNIQWSIQNNPNLPSDKQPVAGYSRPYELQIASRPVSYINVDHTTSDI